MDQTSSLSNIPGKASNITAFVLLILVFSVVHIESPLYSLSYPEMISYFHVTAEQVENLMRYNFLGIVLGGLLAGAVSDSYGRKRVLLCGLGLNTLTSLGCALSGNFNLLLVLRFISGLAQSTQLILTMTILFDVFSDKKSAKAVSLFNSGVGLFSIISPIFAGFIIDHFYWKMNLYAANGLAIFSFLSILIFLKETHPSKSRISFNLLGIFKGYLKLISNFNFVSYTIIYKFVHVLLIVCAANLSVIFMKYLSVPAEVFANYQASTPAIYILFSFLCIKFIDSKGIDYTNNLGFLLTIIGAIGLILIALFSPNNGLGIIIAINLVMAGGALMNAFIVKAAEVFPNIKGSSMAIASTIEYLLISRETKWTEIFFNGSIMPIAVIIFAFTLVIVALYGGTEYFKRKKTSSI